MGSVPVMQTTIANDLQDTLETVLTDETSESSYEMSTYFEERSTTDAFVDITEFGGLGLAQYVPEGEEVPSAGISEGAFTRIWMRKSGLASKATEEALDDGKTDKVINLAKRLKRACRLAVDIDAANIFNRATDTDHVGGDGQPLASTTHTLPGGGTFSNKMTTATSPGGAAYVLARAQADEYVDRDGIAQGQEIMKVCFPINQRGVWEVQSFSAQSPDNGNFHGVNLLNKDGVKLCPIRHWTASDVDYSWVTDADDGLLWYWRRKNQARTWLTESNDVMNYSLTYRAGRLWADPRCIIYADN